ncbi:hypothetical protein ECEC4402_5579, partial [Escherichia coli EC4402]
MLSSKNETVNAMDKFL